MATFNRHRIFVTGEVVERLISSFRNVLHNHPFNIDAMVILTKHLHCIWTLPPGDTDFSLRWRLIKAYFSQTFNAAQTSNLGGSRAAKHEKEVWQRRFWEHAIRDERDYIRHVEYIHYNPVKHGLVSAPADWPYSNFHRFVEQGFYDTLWGSDKRITFDAVVWME